MAARHRHAVRHGTRRLRNRTMTADRRRTTIKHLKNIALNLTIIIAGWLFLICRFKVNKRFRNRYLQSEARARQR